MNSKCKILVTDDEPGIRDMLQFELGQEGYRVFAAANATEALEVLKKENIEIAISDIKMPGMDGIDLLGEIKKINPDIEVIMATGFGTIDSAINALRRGAFDFIGKPFNIEELHFILTKCLEKRSLKETVILYEISKSIFSSLETDTILGIIISSAIKIFKADDASIMLTDEMGRLFIASSKTLSREICEETKLALGERISGWSARGKEPLILVNGLENDERFRHINNYRQIKSALVVPLIGKNENILGVLNINRINIAEPFHESDLEKARLFISLAAMAVENIRLYGNLKKAQAQLVQSEKMASIGQLAAGIAHEINNPVGFISSNLSVLKKYFSGMSSIISGFEKIISENIPGKFSDNEIQKTAEKIKKDNDFGFIQNDLPGLLDETMEGVGRVNKIVASLKNFAHPAGETHKPSDLNAEIDKALVLVWNQLKYNCEVIKDFQSIPPVTCNQGQIGQVFVNLLINAAQAMEEKKGKIRIKTRQENSTVFLEFSDTGQGITEENISRVFDPFFTTKDVGKGTGLGLSLVYGIINDHKWSIDVKSRVNEGTVFTIKIPLPEEKNT
ncbi:MAG TPA: hypothetical protein DC049_09840 [Spirochaetia bacterium]|nr:hypothetical protein [Spirochaetia bacterium]